jgi:hypothetical protein
MRNIWGGWILTSLSAINIPLGHVGVESSEPSPAALESKLLEASMAGKSSTGSMSSKGNLVPESPTWRITGRRMAANQQMEFCLMSLDLVDLVMLVLLVFASAVLPPNDAAQWRADKHVAHAMQTRSARPLPSLDTSG